MCFEHLLSNLCYNCYVKKHENKQKVAGFGPFKKLSILYKWVCSYVGANMILDNAC